MRGEVVKMPKISEMTLKDLGVLPNFSPHDVDYAIGWNYALREIGQIPITDIEEAIERVRKQ